MKGISGGSRSFCCIYFSTPPYTRLMAFLQPHRMTCVTNKKRPLCVCVCVSLCGHVTAGQQGPRFLPGEGRIAINSHTSSAPFPDRPIEKQKGRKEKGEDAEAGVNYVIA